MENKPTVPSKDLVSTYKKADNAFINRHFDNIVIDFNVFISAPEVTLNQRDYDIHFVCFMDGCLNALDRESAFRKGLEQ
jgi:hypothetical protein